MVQRNVRASTHQHVHKALHIRRALRDHPLPAAAPAGGGLCVATPNINHQLHQMKTELVKCDHASDVCPERCIHLKPHKVLWKEWGCSSAICGLRKDYPMCQCNPVTNKSERNSVKPILAIALAALLPVVSFAGEDVPQSQPKPDALIHCAITVLALGGAAVAIVGLLRMCDNIPSPSYIEPADLLTNLPPCITNNPASNHLAHAASRPVVPRVAGYLTFERGFDPDLDYSMSIEIAGPDLDFKAKASITLGCDGLIHTQDGCAIAPIRCDRPDGVFYIFDLRRLVPMNDAPNHFYRMAVNQ